MFFSSGRGLDMPALRRPLSFPFAEFLQTAADGALPKATYTIKEDGFRVILRQVEEGAVAYFSKAGNPIRITDKPETMMEAIVLNLRSKYPGLSPACVVDECTYDTRGRCGVKRRVKRSSAQELHLEFVAEKDGRSYMRGLWTKECLDPATKCLNERDFTYHVVAFDCVFDEEGDTLAYFKRREVLGDSLAAQFTPRVGRAMVCDQVEGAEDMLNTLLTQEGLVFHEADGTCWKVKMPRVVMNLRIMAVANTIPDFAGYNLIYVAAPDDADGATWSVIHVFDWTELFTKYDNPKQGRAYINPRSVKVVDGGRLGCTSSCLSMQPLVNAVFRAVSGSALLPACPGLTKTKAVVRVAGEGTVTIACGASRSFSFTMNGLTKDNGPLFLAEPVEVTVGCSELWEISNEELHLQPAWILALEGYGPAEYMSIVCQTSMPVLRELARDPRNDPVENYKKVGMGLGPFLGLRKQICRAMTHGSFYVPQ